MFNNSQEKIAKLLAEITPENVKMIHDKDGNVQVEANILVANDLIVLTIDDKHIGLTIDDAKAFAVGMAMAVGSAMNEPAPNKDMMN